MAKIDFSHVSPETVKDFTGKLSKDKEKENLDVRVRLLLGKNGKAMDKFRETDGDAYGLILENMAMITILYSRLLSK